MFGYLIFISIDFYDLSLISASIEKIYQTLKTVLEQLSKHLELRQKYFAARRIFNSLLGIWKCGEIRTFVLDSLLADLCSSKITSLTYMHYLTLVTLFSALY